MEREPFTKNGKTDKTQLFDPSQEEPFQIKKESIFFYLLGFAVFVLFIAFGLFYFVFSHNPKEASRKPEAIAVIRKNNEMPATSRNKATYAVSIKDDNTDLSDEKPSRNEMPATSRNKATDTVSIKDNNTDLSDEELSRLEEYFNNISSCNPESPEDRESYIECIGGKSKLDDYISLFDRRAAKAKRSAKAKQYRKTMSPPETPPKTQGLYKRKGYIKSVYKKGKKMFVDIDYIEHLFDGVKDGNDFIDTLEASYACVEDGECDKESCLLDLRLNCMDNGHYIRNRDQNTYALVISDKAVIHKLASASNGITFTTVNPQELFRMKNALCEITIDNNQVISIEQRYIP